MTESVFVRFEPCPKCGSRDNLSVWSDGHKYCFGCQHYETPTGEAIDRVKNKIFVNEKLTKNSKVKLPTTISANLTHEVMYWLESFFVTEEMAVKWKFKWDYENKNLILPIYDGMDLVMYQERYFGPDKDKPKYRHVGNLGNFIPVDYPTVNSKGSSELVVVVEDIISAKRVSEVACATPLLGSYLSKETATRLATRFPRAAIWLDHNMLRKAMDYKRDYSVLFDELVVIDTPRDPKYHTNDEMWYHVYRNFNWE